jgi:hypothetical protein
MSAYVVRQIGGGENRGEFVGIFIADGEDALAAQVARTHGPDGCEFAALPTTCMYAPDIRVPGTSGLYREERTIRPVGDSDDEWREWFLGGSGAQWRRFGQDRSAEEVLILSLANG